METLDQECYLVTNFLGAPIVPSLERLTQERHLVANLDRVVWEHPLVAK